MVSTQWYQYPFLPLNFDLASNIDILHLKSGYCKNFGVLFLWTLWREGLYLSGTRSPAEAERCPGPLPRPALCVFLVIPGLNLPSSPLSSCSSPQCCPGVAFFINILLRAHRAFCICVLMYFINSQYLIIASSLSLLHLESQFHICETFPLCST